MRCVHGGGYDEVVECGRGAADGAPLPQVQLNNVYHWLININLVNIYTAGATGSDSSGRAMTTRSATSAASERAPPLEEGASSSRLWTTSRLGQSWWLGMEDMVINWPQYDPSVVVDRKTIFVFLPKAERELLKKIWYYFTCVVPPGLKRVTMRT